MLPVLQSLLALFPSTPLEECQSDSRGTGEGDTLTPEHKCRVWSVFPVNQDPNSGVTQPCEPCSKDASEHMCTQAKQDKREPRKSSKTSAAVLNKGCLECEFTR